jgi:uncharacterized protein (DUF1499 family)
MNDAPTTKRPRGTRWCLTGIALAGIGALLVVLGLLGARAGLFGPLTAFMAFGIGGLAFVVSILSTIVGLLLSKGSAGTASSGLTWTALIVAAVFFAGSLSLRPETSGTAPIHDITTDIGNPPSFDAIIPLRVNAPNPPEYAGAETAEQQRTAYPDIQTLTLEKPTDEVFDAANSVINELGWDIVSANRDTGHIEATATTFWFRFKDDVVIRLSPSDDGTYVDIRSKSRVGTGDMGANAARVRQFLQKLSDVVGA